MIAERAGSSASRSRASCSAARSARRSASYYSGSPWVGVLGGDRRRRRCSRCSTRSRAIRFRADQVVVGIAINLLAIGLTRFFLRLAFDSSSNSPRVPGFGGERAAAGSCALRRRTRSSGSGIADVAGRGVAALPHAVRAARARGGRASDGGGVGRHQRGARALPRRRALRRARRRSAARTSRSTSTSSPTR